MSDIVDDITNDVQNIILTYNEGGRGRKYCPGCEKYVGARNKKCICGFEFKLGVKYQPEITLTPEQEKDLQYINSIGRFNRETLVYTPAGKCPVKLPGHSKNAVLDWCDELIYEGKQMSRLYMPDAIRYYARQLATTEHMEKVLKFVNKWIEAHYE